MQAHGAKAHIRDHGGNSFADMLAATGDKATAEEQAPTAQTAPPTNAGAAAPGAQAGQDTDAMPDDAPDDTQASATAPQILAGISSQGAKPQVSSGKDVGDKTADDKDKVKPQEAQPANDNSAAAQVMPQPMPAPPPAAANGTPGDASAAPVGAAQAAGAPQAAKDAASDETDGSKEEDAAAPQAGQIAANATGSKPAADKAAKPTADVKKAADGAKTAAAKPDAAAAQNKIADADNDARKADASQADAKAADASQAGARPVEAAAPQANGPQDATPSLAAPAAASSNPATAASTPPPAAATPAVHHVPNLNSLAVEIAAKSQGGAKQFDIRLDPPELGRVDVRLAIDANGKTQAHLTADQPQTLDLLQKDASSLTRALRDAGLDVSQDGLNFSLRNQQPQTGQEQNSSQGGRTWRGSFATPAPTETINATGAYAGRGLSLLDIKV